MAKATHTFVVPAHGRSIHLQDCLESLAKQRLPSEVVVSTSTPFYDIEDLCQKYGASLSIHSPNRGIGHDWNAALHAGTGELVTVAHQDDIYLPDFSQEVVAAHGRRPRSALYFCNACEVTENGSRRVGDTNNSIKQKMIALAYSGRDTVADALSRRLLLGFGNPIVCPAVTINRRVAGEFRFREDLRTNMDWFAWLELSDVGAVTRINKRLMCHRVHADSETARCLDDGVRRAEDEMVFRQLWPSPLASVLARLYSRSYGRYI